MSNGQYMGPGQANALTVGTWQQIVGQRPGYARVTVRPRGHYGGGQYGNTVLGPAPGAAFGWGERGRHRHHREREVRREEWELAHPGESWEMREAARWEWERTHPGQPFVGAEAQVGAWQQIVGLALLGGQPVPLGGGAGFPPRNALVDAPGPERAGREILPMSTGVAILTGQSAQITARPQRVAFRPERVFISASGTAGGAADWIINDIKIGNRSQFSQSGDVPGDMFANNAIDSFISFETAQTAMDVVLVVTYVGTNSSGAAFYGAVIGTAAI